jgi:hypothetical protein
VHIQTEGDSRKHSLMYRCVSELGSFATLFFLVWQRWSRCHYCHFVANFKAFELQCNRGLEHIALLL